MGNTSSADENVGSRQSQQGRISQQLSQQSQINILKSKILRLQRTQEENKRQLEANDRSI